MTTRRSFLGGLARGAGGLASFRAGALGSVLAAGRAVTGRSPEEVAAHEDYWREIQQAFTVDRSLVNLNNGGVSPSPRIVQEAMRRYLELSNEAPVYTMWQLLEPQIESVRRRLASAFGCDPEEMAITRNASEALEICMLGLDLKPGDEVLTTNQDYPRMLTTWRQRERRDGIVLKTISFPVPPASMDDLADRFRKAITPRTKVILVCHITNLTGQIFPVILYVRKEKIERLWPLMAAPPALNANVRKFEEIGTHPAANHNAIAEALTFHEGIGIERKAARLRYLKDRWARRLEKRRGVRILTSFDPAMSCGLANVSVAGADPVKLAAELWDRRRIIVTPIVHEEFRGLRVTPNVYTTVAEVDAFVEEMERVTGGAA